jgi:hypothetical protein
MVNFIEQKRSILYQRTVNFKIFICLAGEVVTELRPESEELLVDVGMNEVSKLYLARASLRNIGIKQVMFGPFAKLTEVLLFTL